MKSPHHKCHIMFTFLHCREQQGIEVLCPIKLYYVAIRTNFKHSNIHLTEARFLSCSQSVRSSVRSLILFFLIREISRRNWLSYFYYNKVGLALCICYKLFNLQKYFYTKYQDFKHVQYSIKTDFWYLRTVLLILALTILIVDIIKDTFNYQHIIITQSLLFYL